MKVQPRVLCLVFAVAALAAFPLAFIAGEMRFSTEFVAITLGAGAAAVLWLWALVAVGVVRRISFGVGALIGLLSFAVVVAVFVSQPAAHYDASWRVAFAAWLLVSCGLYPALVGGLLGHFFRRVTLQTPVLTARRNEIEV
jgi:hypothetical protein